MTLSHPWVLHFLWILPLTGFALVVRHRRRRRAMERFAEPALMARLTLQYHSGKRFLKALLLLTALGILLLALAGPRWGNRYQEVSRKGADIMVLVDVSRSMMVEDVKPYRLERARREILDLLRVIEGDRIGLTAFAGAAFVQCPLTLDYAALEMFLSSLEPGIIPVPGTDLGKAIDTGLSAFDFKTETDKVMLIITDGEDNEKRGLEAAQNAARQDVKIFVFGIGDLAGGPIPAGDGKGGFKKDENGNLVLSKLDEQTLQDIATVTGGGYVRAMTGDLDLDLLYFEGIKKKTEAQTLKSGKIKVYEERFNVFILIGFLLLFLEELLDDKRRLATQKRWGVLITFCCLIPLVQPPCWVAAETPDEFYRKGQYEAAQKAYAQGDLDHPKDVRYRYNRGCAAFQNGQYPEAAAAFSSVLRRTKDPEIRFKAAYNLGNTAFKQEDFASAAAYYRQALAENPYSNEARHNIELSLRALEKMKQNPEQPSQEGENSSGKPDEKSEGDDKPSGNKDSGQDDSGKQKSEMSRPDSEKNAGQNGSNEKPDTSREDDTKGQPKSNAAEKSSGDLKPRQAMPELNPSQPLSENDKTDTDAKSAEALLDNIHENPAAIMRYMLPEENQQGRTSGRDW